MSNKVDVPMWRGKTFNFDFLVGQPKTVFKSIVAVDTSAPVILQATAHGLPEDWPFTVEDARGCELLNSTLKDASGNLIPYQATVVDSNHVSISDLNGSQWDDYVSDGIIRYTMPADVSLYNSALMKVRPTYDSATVLATFSTSPGAGEGLITIDNTRKRLSLSASATIMQALDFASAVYDLEAATSAGKVDGIAYGNVYLQLEAAR